MRNQCQGQKQCGHGIKRKFETIADSFHESQWQHTGHQFDNFNDIHNYHLTNAFPDRVSPAEIWRSWRERIATQKRRLWAGDKAIIRRPVHGASHRTFRRSARICHSFPNFTGCARGFLNYSRSASCDNARGPSRFSRHSGSAVLLRLMSFAGCAACWLNVGAFPTSMKSLASSSPSPSSCTTPPPGPFLRETRP